MSRLVNMGWQVTATTIDCEHVADFATIIVQPSGVAKCSFVNRYSRARDSGKKLKGCKWPDCPLVNEFRQRALAM